MLWNENEVKERLAKIEANMLRSNRIEEIWKLKAEHKELSRLLKRVIREKTRHKN